MTLRFAAFLSLALVCYCDFILASASIHFDHLTTESGLPQSVVNDMTQDASGFVWIATQSGLARYDGYEFNIFRNDPADPTSLGGDWVWALASGAKGDLWIGTDSGGLCHRAASAGGFTCFRHDPKDPSSLASDRVGAVLMDPLGNLWIGTDAGLNHLNIQSGVMTRKALSENLAIQSVSSLTIDAAGDLWLGTNAGHVLRLPNADVTAAWDDRSDALASSKISDIVSDTYGNTWIATGDSGLYQIAQDGEVTHYSAITGTLGALQSNRLTSALLTRNGNLLLGSYSQGLIRFDPQLKTFTEIQHQAVVPSSLNDNHVVSLLQDQGNVIWVGTFNGISKWNPTLGSFQTYRRIEGSARGLSSNYITAFAQNQSNELWIGTHEGVNQLDLATDTIRYHRHDPDDPQSLNDNRVFALEFDAAGGLWVGTMTGGLNYKAPGSNIFTRPFAQTAESPVINTGITSLLSDQAGHLWVGTYGAGLFKVDPVSLTVKQYLPGDDGVGLSSASVLSLFRDSGGSLWIGTNGGGLNRLDLDSETFTPYAFEPNNSTGLASDTIFSIHEDTMGNLWIGTSSNGLNRWNANDRQAGRLIFDHFGLRQGLPDKTVHGILSEADGTVWFSSNAGLVRFDPQNNDLKSFNSTHGLQHAEFNFAAALRTLDGRMAFGGIKGFNLFDPNAIATNTHSPKLALIRFIRGHQESPLTRNDDNALDLNYKDVIISFEFAALDFTAPEKNYYQHRLLGFNDTWSEDGSLRRVTYTNLDPGSYTLQVRASNNDGVWSEQMFELPINVEPPPWNTTLAKLLYATLAGLIALAIYRNQARLKANAMAIRSKNETLSREIELRRIQEQALIVEKEINQQYLDIVEVMILVLDDHGNILQINQKGTRILGFSQEELLYKNFFEMLIPEDSREQVRAHFARDVTDIYLESPVLTHNNEIRTIAWHTTHSHRQTPDQKVQTSQVITSGMDMTQLRDLERRMSEAQKMEALGNLARGIAHDFNNILSSILGYTELSLADLPSTSPVTTNLKRLEASTTRARELVDSILTFSREDHNDPEPVVLPAMLQEAIALIEPMLPTNIALNLSVDNPNISVLADPTQMLQLITNLCTNAQHAMAEVGGVLSVELTLEVLTSGHRQLASTPDALTLVPGEYAMLTISDTGVGMSAEIQQRIFDPFFSTKSREEGTGLGLSVVHGIVRQLGGSIRVESLLGQGSKFILLIPCSTTEIVGKRTTAEQGAAQAVPKGSETILFVDDEKTVVNIAQELLQRMGYTVINANNGHEALEIFDQRGDEISLLITDQSMPLILGTELAAKTREIKPTLAVILISGGGMDRSGNAVDLYLQKPYTQRELAQAIRSVLDRPARTSDGETGAA